MVRRIVGWFAVVVGLLLVAQNVVAVRAILDSDKVAVAKYVQITMRGMLLAGGLALVFFGLGRLKRVLPRASGPHAPGGEGPDDGPPRVS